MEELDLSTITPEELASLDPIRRAKLKTAIQRQLMVEKLKLGPLQPPSETAGKMPMAPGQLPPVQDPERGYGGIAVPPNPFTSPIKGAGAAIGGLGGGPLGMALGSTVNTPEDVGGLALGGFAGKALNTIPASKNILARIMQGVGTGLGTAEGTQMGRQAGQVFSGQKPKEQLSPQELALSSVLGIWGKRGQNLLNQAKEKIPTAISGKNLELEAKNLDKDLETAKNYANKLEAINSETKGNYKRTEAALRNKGITPTDITEATKSKKFLPTEEYTRRKLEQNLIDIEEELGKNSAVIKHIKDLKDSNTEKYVDIIDKLGIGKSSKVRSQAASLLNNINERIPLGPRTAIYLHGLGKLLLKNNESKTASAMLEKLSKQYVDSNKWKNIDKLVPLLINEIE